LFGVEPSNNCTKALVWVGATSQFADDCLLLLGVRGQQACPFSQLAVNPVPKLVKVNLKINDLKSTQVWLSVFWCCGKNERRAPNASKFLEKERLRSWFGVYLTESM
jgi:hypothetical protein